MSEQGKGSRHRDDQHKISLVQALDEDSLLSIARFLSGCDAYRLALTAKKPFFSTFFRSELLSDQPSNLHSNSLALLSFNEAKLPGKTRVRVVDKGDVMCLGITASPFQAPSGQEVSVGKDVSESYRAVGVTDLTVPGNHAVVRLDSGSCIMVPYADMQLLNSELHEYLKRALDVASMDVDAMRVLGYCLMNGEGGLQQSCNEGGYWLVEAAKLGDEWSDHWLRAVAASREDGKQASMSRLDGPKEPSEAFRTLAEAEAWEGWVVSPASSPLCSQTDQDAWEENSDEDDNHSASSRSLQEAAAHGVGMTRPMASTLVHRAMKQSLHDILQAKKLTFEDIFPPGVDSIDIKGRPQVLIAGSAMVQAVLGKRWNSSDIDVFCTWEAAPLVRERLIASGLVCHHCGSHYGDSAPLPDAGTFIHHVEGFCTPDEEEFSMEQALKWGEEHLRDAGSRFALVNVQKIFGQVRSQMTSAHACAREACMHACSSMHIRLSPSARVKGTR